MTFKDYIKEHSYNATDIIDPKEINLKAEYDKLNMTLFGGQLPTLPLKWKKSKNSFAHVAATRIKRTGEITLKNLSVSTYFKYDYQTFINLLAHELIHVYLMNQNINERDGGHGFRFKEEMRRINGLNKGIKVTLTHDASDLEVAVKTTKNIGVVLFKRGEMRSIFVADPSLLTKDVLEFMKSRFSFDAKSRKVDLEFIALTTTHNSVLKYPMKRKFNKRTMSTYQVSEPDWKSIMKNSKIINRDVVRHDA